MKPKEIQKIRERHQKELGRRRCQHCFENWPCDITRVLDAWSFEKNMQKIEDISVELDLPK